MGHLVEDGIDDLVGSDAFQRGVRLEHEAVAQHRRRRRLYVIGDEVVSPVDGEARAVDRRVRPDAVKERDLVEGPEIRFAETVIDNGAYGKRTIRFETGGFCVWFNLLFGRPWDVGRKVEVEAAELALILEGIDLAGARRRVRWSPPSRRPSIPHRISAGATAR